MSPSQVEGKKLFDRLVSEAWQQPFSGWDFGYIAGRMHASQPAWDYRSIVAGRSRGVQSLLDMGTGGGEFLSSLQPLPHLTYASEGYLPNIPVARACLEPLGVKVLVVQEGEALPLEDDSLDLVINRHESFTARQVYRVLKPGGRFITQQVEGFTPEKYADKLFAIHQQMLESGGLQTNSHRFYLEAIKI